MADSRLYVAGSTWSKLAFRFTHCSTEKQDGFDRRVFNLRFGGLVPA